MICIRCKEEGLKSKVFENGPGQMTLAYCPPFYDEDGKYHNHDSNHHTNNFLCSNGHLFVTKMTGSCWCGWNKDKVND